MEPAPKDVVLEEEIDEHYEPTEEELVEYATWLGMDLPNHQNLLWVAKEALKAPLPDNWKPCLTEEDEIYYFNFGNGQSIWDHPCDEYYRNLYKEEVDKQNHQKQCKQSFQGPKPKLESILHHFQGNNQVPPDSTQNHEKSIDSNMLEEMVVAPQTSSNSLQLGERGNSVFSGDSMGNWISKGLKVDSKSFSVSCFPVESSVACRSSFVTRSLPAPQTSRTENKFFAALDHNKSYAPSGSRIPAYANRTGNQSLPAADTSGVQEAVPASQTWKTDHLSSKEEAQQMETAREEVDAQVRNWVQEEERREIEGRICQMRDRIQEKLVDEERIVLQQERIEMLERVCKQVQEEECQILDSLRREIIEKMERHIQMETQALLARRRKEVEDEVEREMEAEKQNLREGQRHQEKRQVQTETQAVLARRKEVEEEVEREMEAEKQNFREGQRHQEKRHVQTEIQALLARRRKEVEEEVESGIEDEKQNLRKGQRQQEKNNVELDEKKIRHKKNTSRRLQSHDEDKKLEEQAEEKQTQEPRETFEEERHDFEYEKNMRLQDLRTSILLKFEVCLKLGTIKNLANMS